MRNGWTVDGLYVVFIDSNHELITMLDGTLEDCHVVPEIITMADCPGIQDSDTMGLDGTAYRWRSLSPTAGGMLKNTSKLDAGKGRLLAAPATWQWNMVLVV